MLLVLLAWIEPSFGQSGVDRVKLDLHPRVCTLAASAKSCDLTVRAEWRSTAQESLCLVIAERSDIKQCWEGISHGTYTIEIEFTEDLQFELRDPQLKDVLVSRFLKVVREALEFRRKRRQPWNILF